MRKRWNTKPNKFLINPKDHVFLTINQAFVIFEKGVVNSGKIGIFKCTKPKNINIIYKIAFIIHTRDDSAYLCERNKNKRTSSFGPKWNMARPWYEKRALFNENIIFSIRRDSIVVIAGLRAASDQSKEAVEAVIYGHDRIINAFELASYVYIYIFFFNIYIHIYTAFM